MSHIVRVMTGRLFQHKANRSANGMVGDDHVSKYVLVEDSKYTSWHRLQTVSYVPCIITPEWSPGHLGIMA